ncbi:hypothetical protein A2U01_0097480, partial [Trifolium medium]|nr:hypothetical protein [Trifolium medium]
VFWVWLGLRLKMKEWFEIEDEYVKVEDEGMVGFEIEDEGMVGFEIEDEGMVCVFCVFLFC